MLVRASAMLIVVILGVAGCGADPGDDDPGRSGEFTYFESLEAFTAEVPLECTRW